MDSFDPTMKSFEGHTTTRRHAMVAESLSRVHRDFDAFLEEKVSLNWDGQRQKIFRHFGLVQKDDVGSDSQPDTSKRSFRSVFEAK